MNNVKYKYTPHFLIRQYPIILTKVRVDSGIHQIIYQKPYISKYEWSMVGRENILIPNDKKAIAQMKVIAIGRCVKS